MEFEEVLEQTIALLQRQGRVSYGALKRRFKLDDAYLEDLKVELIEAQQLAHDENGRLLDVHFVNPSPVFCLDKAGGCGHSQTRNMSILPNSSQGPLSCQYLMLPQ
jgi:hypothetical protein